MRKEFFIAILLSCLNLGADECNDYYTQWIGIGHREGKGVGFKEGYTSFSTFLVAQKDFFCFCPLIDMRVHVFNDGKPAGNIGIGGRAFFDEAVAGLNLFYDFRKTENRLAHQIGVGLEWLGTCWDFFANAYIPVGPIKSHFFDQKIHQTRPDTFLMFAGHQLILAPVRTDIFKERQYEFGGFDAFARRALVDNGTLDLSAEIGPYFYWGEYKKNIYGASARLSANVLEYFVLTGEVNYDSLFRTTMNAQLSFQIPFGSGAKERRESCSPSSILQSKLTRRVDRREIIPVKFEKTHLFQVDPSLIALNPAGDPYHFIFVNNTNSNGGNGTYENPYATLSLTQAGSAPEDIIYVYQADGTSTGMDEGYVFQDFQQMYGSGTAFTLNALQGSVLVPAMSAGMPTITNLNGNGLTLANSNLVNGIYLLNPAANGIYGQNITDATLTNNLLQFNSAGSGIYFVDSKGTLMVQGNILESSYTNPPSSSVGIYFSANSSANAEFIVQNNSVTNFNTSIRSVEQSVVVTALIENNFLLSPSGIGIGFSNGIEATGFTQVSGNTIQSAGAQGISIFAGESSFREVQLYNNSVLNSSSEGIFIGTVNGGVLTANVSGNEMYGNGTSGFLAQTSASSGGPDTLCLNLSYNESDNGYSLVNELGTDSSFYLEPLVGNSGTISEVNTITAVPSGFCSE